MTSAGAATVAYAKESTYQGSLVDSDGDGNTDWIQPFIDITVSTLSVEEALERSRHPDDPTPQGSREGNWEGALEVSGTITDTNFHDLVFADGGTALPNSVMEAPSATWYFGVDLPDGSTEPRTAAGAIVTSATINYEQGSPITADLTIAYGSEPTDVTAPSSIQQPSRTDAFEWHGASFTVDGMSQALMQSASLSLSNLHRFRRGQDRHPYDAVTAAIEPSLSTDATFTERDQLALAVDNAGDTVGKVQGSLAFENGQGTTFTYNLSGLQPNSYSWADLVNPDTDLHEPIEYHVADVGVA